MSYVRLSCFGADFTSKISKRNVFLCTSIMLFSSLFFVGFLASSSLKSKDLSEGKEVKTETVDNRNLKLNFNKSDEHRDHPFVKTEFNSTIKAERTRLKSEVTGKTCKELQLKYNVNKSDAYFIAPDINTTTVEPIKIYCDMETDGGGWSVIQRRGVRDIPKAQRESFNRTWVEYENGFGSPLDDHWIGLKNIYYLTHQNDCGNELMITLTGWDGSIKYAKYSNFIISGSEDDYRLSVEGHEGNVTDISAATLIDNNNATFSTFHKESSERNCAKDHGGAWWHSGCTYMTLNGEYSEDGDEGHEKKSQFWKGIYWYSSTTGAHYGYKKTLMKIRSKC